MVLPKAGTNDTYTQGFIDGIMNPPSAAWLFAGSGTVTLDTLVTNTFRLTFAAGGAPTISLTNPTDGRTIKIIFNVGVTALSSVIWPAGTYWPDGQPVFPANRISVVWLRYDSTLSAWHGLTDSQTTRRSVVDSIHSNQYPTNIDATFESHQIINTGGSNIVVNTPTNMVDGQYLRIMYYRSAAQTITWPTNFKWMANTAPVAPTAATRNYYTLKYMAGVSNWYECAARCEGVANS